jgi:hypothetical protein
MHKMKNNSHFCDPKLKDVSNILVEQFNAPINKTILPKCKLPLKKLAQESLLHSL